MWLHADHPQRLQAGGLKYRSQARPERGINAGTSEHFSKP